MFLETRHIPCDGILDVRNGFIACPPLRDTAWKSRTFGHELPVFIWLDQNSIKHVSMFARQIAYVNDGVMLS